MLGIRKKSFESKLWCPICALVMATFFSVINAHQVTEVLFIRSVFLFYVMILASLVMTSRTCIEKLLFRVRGFPSTTIEVLSELSLLSDHYYIWYKFMNLNL